VKRIASAWREHFARTVVVKFNCFFLMPFVDEFPLALREKIDDLFSAAKEKRTIEGGYPDLDEGGYPDLDSARQNLENTVKSLEIELDANTRLHTKFQRIQRSLGIPNADLPGHNR